MLEIQLVDYTKARGTIHEIRHQVFTWNNMWTRSWILTGRMKMRSR